MGMAEQPSKSENPSNVHETQLKRHCRVCAKPFARNEYKYSCSANSEVLKVLGIDVGQENPAVHPPAFCNTCYATAL